MGNSTPTAGHRRARARTVYVGVPGYSPDVSVPDIPLAARVALAHAYAQALAEDHGVDLLHIKGPAATPELRGQRGGGTDVDVLVRPAHVRVWMAALAADGWSIDTDFTTSSVFEHAATLRHQEWGLMDVHRRYPGLDRDPEATFARLWSGAVSRPIAHYPCPVPEEVAERLILLTHAARSAHPELHADVAASWGAADAATQGAVEALAADLGADVPLRIATGRAAQVAHLPEAAVWLAFEHPEDRLGEWQARWRSAATARAKVTVVVRGIAVNRHYLEAELGRPATGTDLARAWWHRAGALGHEVRRRLTERRS